MSVYSDNLPIVPESPDEFAYIVDPETGYHYDTAYNMETASNYIIDWGYIAVAVQDQPTYPELYANGENDEILTKTELQEAFDRLRDIYLDCWG